VFETVEVLQIDATSETIVHEVVEEVIVAQQNVVHEIESEVDAEVLATEESVFDS
jgi:hypothetical protein